jgi:anti-sigma B factor antagonist
MNGVLQLRVECQEGVELLAVAGELEIATSPEFRRAVSGLLGAGVRGLVVDLRDCTFVDSTGIGALIWAELRARAAGGEVAYVGRPGPVVRAIAMAGLGEELHLRESLREAAAEMSDYRSVPVAASFGRSAEA